MGLGLARAYRQCPGPWCVSAEVPHRLCQMKFRHGEGRVEEHRRIKSELEDRGLKGWIGNRRKNKKGTCRRSLYECPFVRKYQEKFVKTTCPYDFPGKNTDSDKQWKGVRRASSAKPDIGNHAETDKLKMLKNKTNEMEKSREEKDERGANASSVSSIRSTRAQDLRSQCNRDLLKPKSVCEKTRVTSPYVSATTQKKKKSSEVKSLSNRSMPSAKEERKKTSKCPSRGEKPATVHSARKKRDKKESSGVINREKTREVMDPKIIKSKPGDRSEKDAGDAGERPGLKKSQTFFICKGPRRGEGDDPGKIKAPSGTDHSESEEEPTSTEPSPLTHNDSFCLIAKSSQSWSHKKTSDVPHPIQDDAVRREKCKKDEKGILKSTSLDLKSVDSLEKIESEKIVRFSDEPSRKRKVFRKYVRKKNKFQSGTTFAWYRKNKIFQKYIQVIKAKSVLHAGVQDDPPENSRSLQVPTSDRERYEAEMLGIIPRRSRHRKARSGTDC